MIIEKTARIWFAFKKLTAKNNALKWGYIYALTPLGSEREKLAFEKTIALWKASGHPGASRTYPNHKPPDALRKCAFERMYIYMVKGVTVEYIDKRGGALLGDNGLSRFAEEEILLSKKRYYVWAVLAFSLPRSQQEMEAVRNLNELNEKIPDDYRELYNI